MKPGLIMAGVLCLTVLLAGVWDIFIMTRPVDGYKPVSQVIWEWSQINPALTLLLGMLLGHLFLPLRIRG